MGNQPKGVSLPRNDDGSFTVRCANHIVETNYVRSTKVSYTSVTWVILNYVWSTKVSYTSVTWVFLNYVRNTKISALRTPINVYLVAN